MLPADGFHNEHSARRLVAREPDVAAVRAERVGRITAPGPRLAGRDDQPDARPPCGEGGAAPGGQLGRRDGRQARPLGIPGEDLPGSHAATEFVGWYNGHPDHTHLEVDLLAARRAVVIGNGNVAIDVARMLVLAPEELAGTDTADHALEVLAASNVEEVVVLGRRGPAQAAFTNPELLELPEVVELDELPAFFFVLLLLLL